MRSALLMTLGAIVLTSITGRLHAEDGYELWLRYPAVSAERLGSSVEITSIFASVDRSATLLAAVTELQTGLAEMYALSVPRSDELRDGSIVLATAADFPGDDAREELFAARVKGSYVVRNAEIDGQRVISIAGNDDIGILYGAFALLRHLQTGGDLDRIDLASQPKIEHRILNHWDNLDGTVERGYAGGSIWNWWRLPEFVEPRYRDYARANASIGINGVVLNNVNAQAEILLPRYLSKAAALADVLRPYGIRVYFSVRFSSPIDLGGLHTADPLDPSVASWWQSTVEEIYTRIPDFGGFLVKADSEGQPGPHRYKRTHAEGANMLAAALQPHDGIVFWRAFVYSQDDPEDRVKQAYLEFEPLDGAFADNVVLQVKNGPLDFQPREPFHPLFGAMPHTPLAAELQITQEYLGFSTHLAYLGVLWEELFAADTHAAGSGSSVASVIDGSLYNRALTAIAGVANIGSDRDWTGGSFTQANWYAFGRMAWNPELSARSIAEEWLRMTFTNEPDFLGPALEMMMRSREAVVDYMTPLGLAHLMGTGHHYGPAPWVDGLSRPEWNPRYYHRADARFIGFDRTRTGSNAVAQYAAPVASRFSKIDTVPMKYLLWFHRLPWEHQLRSGRTLWEELVVHYDRGVAEVERIRATWSELESYVDPERFAKVSAFLAIQSSEARWWRDACLAYFSKVSRLPLPADARKPEHALEYYMQLSFPNAPGN